jgi:hypothetical protein
MQTDSVTRVIQKPSKRLISNPLRLDVISGVAATPNGVLDRYLLRDQAKPEEIIRNTLLGCDDLVGDGADAEFGPVGSDRLNVERDSSYIA